MSAEGPDGHRGRPLSVPDFRDARPERIAENAHAAEMRLDSERLARIDELARLGLAEDATLL
jgi:diketogulonate reductase-like aldo/keto reductase